MDENKVVATETTDEGKTSAPSQTEKPQRTPQEVAAYNLKKKAEEAKELGIDPAEILGVKARIDFSGEIPDDAPLTVGTFRELARQDARKTAEQMADAIVDADERERVKNELKFIVPSGDAQADFRRAQAAANAERNAKIAVEAARRAEPQRTAAGGSSPAQVEGEFTPTPDEEVMMRPPYNLSKEKILAARQIVAQKAG